MTERSDGPGEPPGVGRVGDDSGALVLDAVPHPAGPVLVHASGEIDTVTAPFLDDRLRAWGAGASRVVLDLSRVSFLGSAGLSVLCDRAAEAGRGGVRFEVVCGAALQVRRVLQITGTMEHLVVLDPVPPGTGRPGGRRAALFAVPDAGDRPGAG